MQTAGQDLLFRLPPRSGHSWIEVRVQFQSAWPGVFGWLRQADIVPVVPDFDDLAIGSPG